MCVCVCVCVCTRVGVGQGRLHFHKDDNRSKDIHLGQAEKQLESRVG